MGQLCETRYVREMSGDVANLESCLVALDVEGGGGGGGGEWLLLHSGGYDPSDREHKRPTRQFGGMWVITEEDFAVKKGAWQYIAYTQPTNLLLSSGAGILHNKH